MGKYFKGVYNFQYKEEDWRRVISLLILLLYELYLGHIVPHRSILIDWRFVKGTIVEANYLKKPKHVWFDSLGIDSELIQCFFFNVSKGVIRFDIDEYAVTG